jgi:O-antigen biosynthesis protein
LDTVVTAFEPSLKHASKPAARPHAAPELKPVQVEGKFFFADDKKLFVKGVTYGPFAPGSHGAQFPERDMVTRDFALMAELGANTVRVFTAPPRWLLDLAFEAGLRVLAGIPWSQHVAFLDDKDVQAEILKTISEQVRALKGHPAIFAYLIGNEVPPDMIRWHGRDRVRAFLKRLYDTAKAIDPDRLVSYANYPSTEYLQIDFTDFVCFNVYLHDEGAFRRYVARLHNLDFDKPLLLTEFGIDSMREGREEQARILSWQIAAAFEMGVAGTFVFAWTDQWFTGGHPIENWDFGLVDRARRPKPAFAAVQARFGGHLPLTLSRYPRVSVVVCSYNAERTMEACLISLEHLAYPDYEVIVINDGSTDHTLEIAEQFPYCRIVSGPNRGLSGARNIGVEHATGEIVAYTDSDCVADPHWLDYLVATMERRGLVACGGPNFPPPEDRLVPSAVAVSPGGPTHVLLADEIAEHIAGCNMAFRRDVLMALGGFDPIYRAAGDDVDFCWRLQDAGYEIGYSPAAMVWHFRRNTVRAYIGQQKGYGKAEALVLAKHPARFNLLGQAKWAGRIYGDLSSVMFPSRRPFIYAGMFGRGLFQTLYSPPAPLAAYLPLSFEWNIAAIPLALAAILAGIVISPWYGLLALPLLASWGLCVNGALKAPIDKRFTGLEARALVAALIYLGPILRGVERLKWRFKTKDARPRTAIETPLLEAKMSPARLAFSLSFWSERGQEKEVLLGGLMRFLPPCGYIVGADGGWRPWDLDIRGEGWTRARILAVAENHGGEKRLLRLRCLLRPSRLSGNVLGACAAAFIVALIFAAPLPAAIFALAGLGFAGFVGARLLRLSRDVQGAVEAVARDADLRPIERPNDHV